MNDDALSFHPSPRGPWRNVGCPPPPPPPPPFGSEASINRYVYTEGFGMCLEIWVLSMGAETQSPRMHCWWINANRGQGGKCWGEMRHLGFCESDSTDKVSLRMARWISLGFSSGFSSSSYLQPRWMGYLELPQVWMNVCMWPRNRLASNKLRLHQEKAPTTDEQTNRG